MENETVLTQEGYNNYVRELEERTAERDQIKKRLEEARGFGDFSENAELDAAREEQSFNESRIIEINRILAVAKVVDAAAVAGGAMSVSIGTTVTVKNDKGEDASYTIVGTNEANVLENRISNDSPAGSALMGHVAGETVQFTTPRGQVRELTIVGISVAGGEE